MQRIQSLESKRLNIQDFQTIGSGPLIELMGFTPNNTQTITAGNFIQNLFIPNGEIRLGNIYSLPVTDNINHNYFTINSTEDDSIQIPISVNNTLSMSAIPVDISTIYSPVFAYLDVGLPPNDYFTAYYIGGQRDIYNFPSEWGLGNGTPHNDILAIPNGLMEITRTEITFDVAINSEPVVPIRAFLHIQLYDTDQYLYTDLPDVSVKPIHLRLSNSQLQGNHEIDYIMDINQLVHRIPIETILNHNVSTNTIHIECINDDQIIAVFIDQAEVEIFYSSDLPTVFYESRLISENNESLYYRNILNISDINTTTIFDVPTRLRSQFYLLENGFMASRIVVNSKGVFQYLLIPDTIVQIWRTDVSDVSDENKSIITNQRTIFRRSDITNWTDHALINTFYSSVDHNGNDISDIPDYFNDAVQVLPGGVTRYYYKIEALQGYKLTKLKLPFAVSIVDGLVSIDPIIDGTKSAEYSISLIDGRDRL